LLGEVADEVESVGAFQSVLTAMEKHSDNAEVQESAVHALKYACASGSISINALVSAISAGMRALPNDHVIQTNGSRLLAHIAVKDSNQLPIAKECGVKAIIEAMKNFLSDSSIQECCCRVLGLLSYNSETQQYVTGLGGIEATVSAMQNCGSVEVLILGCGTLTCLAMTEKNVDRIRDIKGVQCVVSAMKKFKDHSGLQLSGCLALKMFSETREVAQQVVEEGGVSVIKEAMAKFPENAELAKEGQEALENINKNRK
jgi:maleate cis-trans isomerase